MTWTIYLSDEIHSDWRKPIEVGAKAAALPGYADAARDAAQ